MGVDIAIYLADYGQRHLVPLPVNGDGHRAPLSVDSSLPGRAFQQLKTVASGAGEEPCLWVPLVNGAERLGVVEVGLGDAADVVDLNDLGLHEQCAWLAGLIGRIASTANSLGDALSTVRLPSPTSVDAELVRHLLPPLAAATDAFTVAGALELCPTVRGDIFDYAISETTARLAMFGAGGSSKNVGIRSAVAVSAYRAARRDGRELLEQSRLVDESLIQQFGLATRLGGLLVVVELTTGRLHYLTAKHPRPVLLKADGTVQHLTGGRRPAFGHPDPLVTPGQEQLAPGDWILLHSDGATEACDAFQRRFGQERLLHQVRAAIDQGLHPAEASRRALQDVVDHAGGELTDDATLMLARWTGVGFEI
jgi:hypothetical protein